MTTMPTMPSSSLSRHSAEVFAAAERGPVEITRRDGESLVLSRKSRQDDQALALSFAADLVAASLAPSDVPFARRLQDRFPWMQFLSEEERASFAEEIVASARACAALRDFVPFLAELVGWRETAQAKALGLTGAVDWFTADRQVLDPTEHP